MAAAVIALDCSLNMYPGRRPSKFDLILPSAPVTMAITVRNGGSGGNGTGVSYTSMNKDELELKFSSNLRDDLFGLQRVEIMSILILAGKIF